MPSAAEELSSRVYFEDHMAHSILTSSVVKEVGRRGGFQELVILCIGTDRSTGDALGPLIGSKLEGQLPKGVYSYGTLAEPLHAANLAQRLEKIWQKHKNALVLAIDACLGKSESVGYISVKDGALKPGTGVNKRLPAVGDFHIIGVVNVGGFMEYFVLQNTRLNLVMKMADVIATSLLDAVSPAMRHPFATR